MMSPVDDLIAKAALSDAVLHADRAETALAQGNQQEADKWLLEALMAYNKATLWQADNDLHSAALQHIKRVAELVEDKKDPKRT